MFLQLLLPIRSPPQLILDILDLLLQLNHLILLLIQQRGVVQHTLPI